MTYLPPPQCADCQSVTTDNIAALATLFPSVVREGKVDFDALQQLLGKDIAKDDELFGLQWKGKAQSRRAATTPSLGTLRPCKEESVDWDTTKNLYIEGDNLEVLKLLRKSYAGKVKMIYIDPPYNTGKEFVYPDNYQSSIDEYKRLTGQQGRFKANAETSGRYHTDWLNMMFSRLVLARDILRQDGVIFISIDDHEQGTLRLLCDEVFGEVNFVANLIWQKKYTRANDAKWFSDNHDFILCYAKDKNVFKINLLPRSGDQLAYIQILIIIRRVFGKQRHYMPKVVQIQNHTHLVMELFGLLRQVRIDGLLMGLCKKWNLMVKSGLALMDVKLRKGKVFCAMLRMG